MPAELLDAMSKVSDELAIGNEHSATTYGQLLNSVRQWQARFKTAGIAPGDVVSIEGEYGRETIAALVASTFNLNIAVPLSRDSASQHARFLEVAQVEYRIRCDLPSPTILDTGKSSDHPLIERIRNANRPGLVLFTSGSTGESKAAIHDLEGVLEKFKQPRQRLKTIVFLQLDHIGGINTLFYTLFNGGAVIVPPERSPRAVCQVIARHKAELLPTSPTFLNLLLISGEHLRWDLSSLKLITYGTEPMPVSTLKRVHAAFPQVRLQQTYGSTELGILRSKSRDDASLWVRVGGDGYETKVVDGRLKVKARAAMLGYLNAPSPFDEEGFLDTGDRVEVDGKWLKILGRDSEIINVGGNKIYPAHVESVLLEMDGVIDAAVSGAPNALLGQVVTAQMRLSTRGETLQQLKIRLRQFCKDKLPPYAVPSRVTISADDLHSARFKRKR